MSLYEYTPDNQKYISINRSILRSMVIDLAQRQSLISDPNSAHGMSTIPSGQLHHYCIDTVFISSIFKKYKNPVMYALVRDDLSKVTPYAAVAAWLTIDDWTWNETPVGLFTKSLNYGLVLKYPIQCIKAACFVTNYGNFNSEIAEEFTVQEINEAYEECVKLGKALAFNAFSNDDTSREKMEQDIVHHINLEFYNVLHS